MTDLPPSPVDAWIGRVVADKYRVTGRLGVGGHGAVFEAENTWTGRRVALKVLAGAAALNAEMSERFLREARVTTRVAHPNIVEVLDMGRDPHDGALFIVQELLQGEDLRSVLRREGTLDPRWLIETLTPVLDALSVAHAQGVVHRDLKPANLFLARQHDGRVVPKLIDFGVSRMDDVPGANELTHAGALLGTPDYMSPEQARGERADALSDVWALGVILYESFAGHRPYRAANYNALLVRILADDAPPLRSVAPHVAPGLAAVVDRCLARDPAHRYPTMTALRDALLPWAVSRADDGGATLVDEEEGASTDPPPDDPTPVSVDPPSMLRGDATEESPAAPPVSFGATAPPPDPPAPASMPVAPQPPQTPSTWSKTPPPRPPPRSLAPWVFGGVLTVGAAAVAAVWLATRPPTPSPVVLAGDGRGPAASEPALDAATPEAAVAMGAVDAADVVAAETELPDASEDAAADDVAQEAGGPRPRVARALPLPSAERPDPREIPRVMRSADLAVARCVNGREGTVEVALTIVGATGAVEGATVAPPWRGTPAGACVVEAIRRLRFTRFRLQRFQLVWPYVVRPAGPPTLGAPITAR